MSKFNIIQRMTRSHLLNAEKCHTGTAGDNPGPTPDQSYASAYATVAGAHAVGGLATKEWAGLRAEIHEHQLISRSK